MRQLPCLLLSLSAVLGATAHEASVFTFDSNRPSRHSNTPSVLNNAAESLLALRTHSENGLMLEQTDPETVEALNELGGTPAPLFGDSRRDVERSLVILEGVGDYDVGSLKKEYSKNLVISSLPASAMENGLLDIGDTKSNRGVGYEMNCAVKPQNHKAAWECISQDPVFRELPHANNEELLDEVDFVESYASKDSSTTSLRVSFKPGNIPKKPLKKLISEISTTTSQHAKEITLVITSSTPVLPRSITKRSTTQTNPQPKRQTPTTILSTPLPVCHSSNTSCTESTRNCSGHGTCERKYSSKDEGITRECFACRCEKTVEEREDGTTKTIRWGGPACQKEDLSSPFWLIAGITVMIASAVGIAISLLFDVGREELPGVIAAGVGPTRQK